MGMLRRHRDGLSMVVGIAAALVVLVLVPGIAPAGVRSALGLGPTQLGTPPEVRDGGTHAFLQHQHRRNDDPVAWDPCLPIEYVVNPEDGPADAETLVADAVAEASRATGLSFEYAGTTDRRPQRAGVGSRSSWAPVLVAWASPSEVPDLEGHAGLGGATAVTGGTGLKRYTTGGITLDVATFRNLAEQPLGQARARAILLHELGHLVGLAHVESPQERMYEGNVGLLEYALGDLNGLAQLGSGRCF